MYGRLSDIYGRKPVLFAVGMLTVADMLCGVAPDAPSFYFFRALGGIANAGINALTMMIISGIVTLEERGKWQGFFGAGIGGGNTVGPLLSAVFALHQTWRAFFWFLAPCAFISGVMAEYGDLGILAYGIHPGGVMAELGSNLPKEMHEAILIDKPELAGDTVVWLTKEKRG